MSTTYSIDCLDHKTSLWIGQRNAESYTFYSGEPNTMAKLEAFLFEHEGCELVFRPDGYREGWSDYDKPSR